MAGDLRSVKLELELRGKLTRNVSLGVPPLGYSVLERKDAVKRVA